MNLKMLVSQAISKVTETALLSIKSEVYFSPARGEATAVVQSAVFDIIDHSMLIKYLSCWFDVGSLVLVWFKSYLCDHYQCIKIGSISSDAKMLLYGVPQGSVLGPILFLLYTTPCCKVIQNDPGICFHFYADDTQLCVHLTHKHVTQAFDRLKNCLDDIKKCLLQTSLSLIQIRRNLFCFTQELSVQKSSPVNILGKLLSPTEVFRILSVCLDSAFSFLFSQRVSYARSCSFGCKSLVGSNVDCCNSLFRSCSALDLCRL